MSLVSMHTSQSPKIKEIRVKDTTSLTITDDDFSDGSSLLYKIILGSSVHVDFCIALVHVKSINLAIEIDAQGDNSSFDIILIYVLTADQSIKLSTIQRHTGKQTVSRLFARGIVKDVSQLEHQGLIVIASQAEKSDAVLSHTAVVLDGKAQVILIPSIEVLNHDVQCSHGAAVGQFDQQHIWYLKARGLDEKEAYQMLVQSFFTEFVDRFDQPEKLLESICQKIL